MLLVVTKLHRRIQAGSSEDKRLQKGVWTCRLPVQPVNLHKHESCCHCPPAVGAGCGLAWMSMHRACSVDCAASIEQYGVAILENKLLLHTAGSRKFSHAGQTTQTLACNSCQEWQQAQQQRWVKRAVDRWCCPFHHLLKSRPNLQQQQRHSVKSGSSLCSVTPSLLGIVRTGKPG
jgi:hypothetical protein